MAPSLGTVMILTGVSMTAKKFVLSFCVGLFFSIVLSEEHVLWDFGVVIKKSESPVNSDQYPSEE